MELLEWLEANIGPKTKLFQNFCGWLDHSAENWQTLDTTKYGMYGFTLVNPGTGLPWTFAEIDTYSRPLMSPMVLDRIRADVRNLEILRKAYHAQ